MLESFILTMAHIGAVIVGAVVAELALLSERF